MTAPADMSAPLRRGAERLTDEEVRFRARLLDAVGEAVIATTADGTICFWSRAAEQLYGWSAAEVVGRPIVEVTPSGLSREQAAEILRRLTAGEPWSGEFPVQRRDGTSFVAHVTDTPVLDESGRLVAIVGVSSDVTDRVQAQEERATLLERERAARAEAEQVSERLQAAGRITQWVMRATTLDEVLEIIVTGVRDALAGDSVAVLLPDAGGELLTVRAAAGRPDGERAPVAIGSGVAGLIAATRQPLVLEDLRAVDVVDPHLRARMASLLGVPLVMDDRLVGVLEVASASPRRFTVDERTMLELVGARAASAIVRAQLHDAERAARHAAEQAWQAAERAREDAERASRAKSDFLAVMSHELRTPLNAISGYADLLAMGIHGPVTDAQVEALRRLRAAGDHLLGMINHVLDHARLQSGRAAYSEERLPVVEVIAAVEAITRPQLDARGLGWRCELAAPDIAVSADREKTVQILVNLVGNAAKFTERGEVRVTVQAHGDAVQVAVRDTGRGIPAARLAEVFDPFVQVHTDSALTRTTPGIGLGLAISRDLARGMGGELSATSTPGLGSTFTLTLPRA